MIKYAAFGAPILMFGYGVLRLIDGLDGDHGPGLAWNLGHVLFLIAVGSLAALMVGIHRVMRTSGRRIVADAFLGVGLLGAACFAIVIAGDLFDSVDDAVNLPDPVMLFGPLALVAGIVGPLVRLALAREVAPWSPPLALIGFVVFSANLDLLPVGAVVLLCGLAPLAHLDAPRDVCDEVAASSHDR
ncbi:MAG: hypothetical protein L0K86_20755 [Actinomycetia bacterium]|nr:hypothetical protein [Actinomycetes bacterium]